jgi:hypothetical protein
VARSRVWQAERLLLVVEPELLLEPEPPSEPRQEAAAVVAE